MTLVLTAASPGAESYFGVRPYDGRIDRWLVFDSFERSSRRPRRELRRLIMRPGVRVLVAHPHGDEATIMGWIAARPSENRVIYTYVKQLWRAKAGEAQSPFRVGSGLALAAGIDLTREIPCSFMTRTAWKIAVLPDGDNPYHLVHSPEAT